MSTEAHRELSAVEHSLLHLTVAATNIPGARELEAQVDVVVVSGGLPTSLDLMAPRSASRSDAPNGPLPIRAYVYDEGGEYERELLVWVEDGYLSGLEFAWVRDDTPSEMPAAEHVRIG